MLGTGVFGCLSAILVRNDYAQVKYRGFMAQQLQDYYQAPREDKSLTSRKN